MEFYSVENSEIHFVIRFLGKEAKEYSPFGRVAFAHFLRFPASLDFSAVYIISVSRQGIAVPKYNFTPECPRCTGLHV
jgi:hypothetical protein